MRRRGRVAVSSRDERTGLPATVFDEVGHFEPSCTECFTIHVAAEVWLSGQDGYLIHATKGAHRTQVVKGEVNWRRR